MPRLSPRTLAVSLVALGFIGTGPGAAETSRVEFEVRLWDPSLSGQIQVLENGFGTEIDLDGDLALGNDSFTDLRLTFHPSRRTVLRFAAVPLEYSGDSIVGRTLTFAGQTFTLSTRVASQLNMDYARAGFAWQFLSTSDGRFRVGPLVEVKGFRGDASLTAPDLTLPVSVTEDFEAAFGSAGLLLDVEASERVSVFGEYTTLVAADEGSQTDFELGVRVQLWNVLHAVAGFRSIQIQFEDGDDIIDVDMDGVFLGASVRF